MANKIILKEGCHVWGNYLSIVCQNWVLLTMDDDFKNKYGDEVYYLVTVPYIINYYGI